MAVKSSVFISTLHRELGDASSRRNAATRRKCPSRMISVKLHTTLSELLLTEFLMGAHSSAYAACGIHCWPQTTPGISHSTLIYSLINTGAEARTKNYSNNDIAIEGGFQ